MLRFMELVLDTLSLGQDIHQSGQDDRDNRGGRDGSGLTYVMLVIVFVIVLAVFQIA